MNFKKKFETLVGKRISKAMRRMRRKHKDMTSSLWWWIGKNIQPTGDTMHVVSKMARYAYNNKFDMSSFGITDMMVLGDKIFIYLKRPGILIGKGGSRIDSILDRINYMTTQTADGTRRKEKVYNYEICLIEDIYSPTAYAMHRMNQTYHR